MKKTEKLTHRPPEGQTSFRKSTCATAANPFFQLMIAAVVQVSKLVWKLKTLRLSHSPTPSYGSFGGGVGMLWLSRL